MTTAYRLRKAWPRLRFPSPEDEALFQRTLAPARLHRSIMSGWIALVIYNGFLIVDWMVSPQVFELGLVLRTLLFTPLGAMLLLAAMALKDKMLRLPAWLPDLCTAVAGVIAAGTVALVMFSPRMGDSLWVAYYHGGFVPVLLYGNVVQRLRFGVASAFTLAILVVHWLCVALSDGFPSALELPMVLFVAAMAGYTLLMNYRLEHEERQRFLQAMRAQALKAQLRQTQVQLEMASSCDPLTGVANRRGLDQFVEARWRALPDSAPLSILLVDVDHFKAYNDHYGHPAGDECLRHVAAELQRHAEPGVDLVARWGGEEFVLVMPGKSLDDAVAVARRLSHGMRGLGVRHERSPTAACVTVSVGVACAPPGAHGTWAELLAQADAALYQAKSRGRNRVEHQAELAHQ